MDEYRSRVRWVATGSAGFYPRLSGLENLEFYAAIMATGMKKGDLEGVLKEFALLEHRDKRVHQYSTGMKQRLNLARAVLAPAHVVLLDEPTTGLDESGISLLDGLINSHWRDATVLIVSHDQEWCSRHANVHWRLDRRELQV
jgi:ABC-2 type transport system ATP-binding protein